MPYRQLNFDRPGDGDMGLTESLTTALRKVDQMLIEVFAALAAEIPAGSILDAMLADMPANTVKGTLAGGVPSNLTAANLRTLLAITSAGATLIAAADAAAQRTALGATTIGGGILTAADAAAVRTLLGATAAGSALLLAADSAAQRTALGATTVGNGVFLAASELSGRTALGAHRMTRGTTRTLTGVSQEWTSIPAGTFKIDLGVTSLGTSGTQLPIIQLGDAGGYETTSYVGSSSYVANAANPVTALNSTGFALTPAMAGAPMLISGKCSLVLSDPATNTWNIEGVFGRHDAAVTMQVGGAKQTTQELDRIRLTNFDGVQTFNSGFANILFYHP